MSRRRRIGAEKGALMLNAPLLSGVVELKSPFDFLQKFRPKLTYHSAGRPGCPSTVFWPNSVRSKMFR